MGESQLSGLLQLPDGKFPLMVRDKSMVAPPGSTRSYPKGCIIIVDPVRPAVPGDRVVARLDDHEEFIFGQLVVVDDKRWLKKLNPVHPMVLLPQSARIVGVVVQTQIDEVAHV